METKNPSSALCRVAFPGLWERSIPARLAVFQIFLASCLTACTNHSSDPEVISGSALTRTLSRTTVNAGETTELSIKLVHQAGVPLAFAYFAEHIPDGLEVASFTAVVDGVDVTDKAVAESSSIGSVWGDCSSYRVILQDPARPANGVTILSSCVVKLTLRVLRPGLYDLARNHWVAAIDRSTPLFGWSDGSLRITCPNAQGEIPVEPQVNTLIEQPEGSSRPILSQSHLFPAFSGYPPDSVSMSLASVKLAPGGFRSGDLVGSASLQFDFCLAGVEIDPCAGGVVVFDVIADQVSERISCSCRVRSVPEAVLSLLKRAGLISESQTLVGDKFGTLDLESSPLETRSILALVPPYASGLSMPWDAVLTLSLRTDLFAFPRGLPITARTRYVIKGQPTTPTDQELGLVPELELPFIRGDANADSILDISDPIAILLHLFLGLEIPIRCEKAADNNDDGYIDISDAVYELFLLFGVQRVEWFPPIRCGREWTIDTLSCQTFPPCS